MYNSVDAFYQASPLDPMNYIIPSQTVLHSEPAQLFKSDQPPLSLLAGSVLVTIEQYKTPKTNKISLGHSPLSSSLTSSSHVNLSPNKAPKLSYSSSEDKFYGADEFHQSSLSQSCLKDSSRSASVLTYSNSRNRHNEITQFFHAQWK